MIVEFQPMTTLHSRRRLLHQDHSYPVDEGPAISMVARNIFRGSAMLKALRVTTSRLVLDPTQPATLISQVLVNWLYDTLYWLRCEKIGRKGRCKRFPNLLIN